jgi:PAS domain S-box-containing protein
VTDTTTTTWNESTWRAVLDASLDAIITIDAKGCIVEFSWAAERIFGHRRCDVLGRDLASIIIPPRFREMHHAGLRRMVETGQGTILDRRMELTALHADGHEFPVELTITAIPHNGQSLFTGFLRDITERKRAEREQQDARQQIQLLLDSVAEGIYGVDINQNCTFVNNAFLRILGYQDASEVIGKHIHSLIHHSHEDGRAYPASECRMYRASATNQTIHADNEVFWRKDGTSFPVEYWSHPIIKDGVSVGAVATFFDISKRKETEAQIRNLAFYDPLTMLPNRRLLIDRLQQALVTNARNKRQAALLFIDLDNFKVINDTRGHDTGDLLLIEAATRLQECVRQGDTIARLGGGRICCAARRPGFQRIDRRSLHRTHCGKNTPGVKTTLFFQRTGISQHGKHRHHAAPGGCDDGRRNAPARRCRPLSGKGGRPQYVVFF